MYNTIRMIINRGRGITGITKLNTRLRETMLNHIGKTRQPSSLLLYGGHEMVPARRDVVWVVGWWGEPHYALLTVTQTAGEPPPGAATGR